MRARAFAVALLAVASIAPAVFKPSSICASMKSAILSFAKPERRAPAAVDPAKPSARRRASSASGSGAVSTGWSPISQQGLQPWSGWSAK